MNLRATRREIYLIEPDEQLLKMNRLVSKTGGGTGGGTGPNPMTG